MSIWVLSLAVVGFFLSYAVGSTHRRLRNGLAIVFLVIAGLALFKMVTGQL